MTNIDNFKAFVRKNPNLITYVRNKSMSWQQFYELYDLYGEENSIWNNYLKTEAKEEQKSVPSSNKTTNTLSNIIEMAKNLDANKIQDGITSIQKAVSLFGDIMLKDKTDTTSSYTPRPIYRKFDD